MFLGFLTKERHIFAKLDRFRMSLLLSKDLILFILYANIHILVFLNIFVKILQSHSQGLIT
jgi:hypothetical protein